MCCGQVLQCEGCHIASHVLWVWSRDVLDGAGRGVVGSVLGVRGWILLHIVGGVGLVSVLGVRCGHVGVCSGSDELGCVHHVLRRVVCISGGVVCVHVVLGWVVLDCDGVQQLERLLGVCARVLLGVGGAGIVLDVRGGVVLGSR